MFGLRLPEILILIAVFALFFGGGKRLEEFARSMGRFIGEFKKGRLDMEREISEIKESVEKK